MYLLVNKYNNEGGGLLHGVFGPERNVWLKWNNIVHSSDNFQGEKTYNKFFFKEYKLWNEGQKLKVS